MLQVIGMTHVSSTCRLVQEYPNRALSWYAVGVYYLATHQYEQARRYFGKATALDANCAVAWIGFGHAFALQDESDQVCFSNCSKQLGM